MLPSLDKRKNTADYKSLRLEVCEIKAGSKMTVAAFKPPSSRESPHFLTSFVSRIFDDLKVDRQGLSIDRSTRS